MIVLRSTPCDAPQSLAELITRTDKFYKQYSRFKQHRAIVLRKTAYKTQFENATNSRLYLTSTKICAIGTFVKQDSCADSKHIRFRYPLTGAPCLHGLSIFTNVYVVYWRKSSRQSQLQVKNNITVNRRVITHANYYSKKSIKAINAVGRIIPGWGYNST